MSIKFSFKDEVFSLDKLQLPSRHYHFNNNENYIKLLNIGEGIFPKDKIRISKQNQLLVSDAEICV